MKKMPQHVPWIRETSFLKNFPADKNAEKSQTKAQIKLFLQNLDCMSSGVLFLLEKLQVPCKIFSNMADKFFQN